MHTLKKRSRWIVLGLVLASLASTAIWMHKNIELVVNGQSTTVSTWAITVQQLLDQQGIIVNDGDQIVPAPKAVLSREGVVRITRASNIRVEVGGEELILHAVNPVPARLLAHAGIELYPGDILRTEHGPIPVDLPYETLNASHWWQIDRAVKIKVKDSTGVKTLASAAATVGQALWEAGIKLRSADRVTPPAVTPLKPGMEITIQTARDIVIQTLDKEFFLQTTAKTVSEALVDAGLSLQGLDYTVPGESEALPDDGRVKLVRVKEDIIIEQTPVPFETTYEAVADLEIDRQTVLEPGAYGVNAQSIRVRYENGMEALRQVEDEWLASAPINRVIGYGTKVVMHSIDTPDGRVDYWRALNVYAVSYKPSDTGGNITSTGEVLKKGIIAVNPNYIPYGTVLYVPGYGFGVAADTGRLPARMIDLGYTDEDYVSWHKNLTVYFVWPPPANIVWIIP